MWKLDTICLLLTALNGAVLGKSDWRRNATIYQIYPRSFKDSNGDGIGDLNGITSKLRHIADIGANAFWLSPMYPSPQADFGYDISDFANVDPMYGTLKDFENLTAVAKSLGLKVLLDFVPNHSSDEHPWFNKSVHRIKPYDDYYVWRDAKIVNGTRHPPNNWLSTFYGSAWEWNPIRGQYYLHQFVAKQPDLNYRNPALRQEMMDVLTFWMDRGVDGFRIDALNYMVEDDRFLDEPRSNAPGVKPDDYDYLNHIYTQNQPETYGVLKSWRKLVDDHAKAHGTDPKILLVEAYAPQDAIIKYFEAGADAPMNFMFISNLYETSSALDFKRVIDQYLNMVPNNRVHNWVVGNHDQHRAASRFGVKRADQLSMLATVLPGISIIYNGDEIGMTDANLTWAETVDPAGCNAGPDRYQAKSRDPERTPFQWDNTTSAGFSTNPKTWLPVNSNYKTLNLAAQKVTPTSHYKVFKGLTALKRQPVVARGTTQTYLATEKVFVVVRKLSNQSPVVLLVNFSDSPVILDARTWLNIPEKLVVALSSVGSQLLSGSQVNTAALTIPGSASIILTSAAQYSALNLA